MRFRVQGSRFKVIILICSLCTLVLGLVGCEAFVRKFTRKPKNENLPKEEMVLAPEEYNGPGMTKEELYHQYFLFWKSWQDELINSLSAGANHKKQVDCTQEAIKNLINLKGLLHQERQKKLEIYISQLNDLKEHIAKDLYGNNIAANRQSAEQIKRNILRDFSYNKVSKDIS